MVRGAAVCNPSFLQRATLYKQRPFCCSPSPAMDPSYSAKRPKLPLRIGTHNGTFHCDEALGCFLLRLTPRFHDAHVVRTRDPAVLENLDAVLDVGGIYDLQKFLFDHHQRGFDKTFGHGFSTKLSSAGLIYKHFGLEIVAKELGHPPTHPDVECVYKAVYKNFLEAIDAVDNGVNQYDTDKVPRYINNTHLSARVGRLNPDWLEESSPGKEDESFHLAMQLAGQEFQDALKYHAKSWLPARKIVSDCILRRIEIHPSGQIMLLKRFCPWKEHIFELEQELEVEPTIKYVLYQDDRNLQWRIQAVAVAAGRFESRKPLPASWRGLMNSQLSKVVGIENCVFVHSSGFIGGNLSFEGVLSMGRKALESEID